MRGIRAGALYNLPDGILGCVVDADIDTSDILADKSKHYENQPSDKKDGGNNGAPAHLNGRIYQLADNHIEAVTKTQESAGCSAYRGNPERLDGKGSKAVELQGQQRCERIAGLARHALMVSNRHVGDAHGGPEN